MASQEANRYRNTKKLVRMVQERCLPPLRERKYATFFLQELPMALPIVAIIAVIAAGESIDAAADGIGAVYSHVSERIEHRFQKTPKQ